jgi:HK97 family phage prohead protease
MISKDREYRAFEFEMQDGMIVTGRAAVFDTPTIMYEYDGMKFYETISRDAFAESNLKDVVLVVNHDGTPAARTRNGTLKLDIQSDGLYVWADISKSSVGPALHEDVKNGVFDRMSFAFTVREASYDRATRTRNITKIDRLYDVSVVTFPAYEQTSVSARGFFEAEAEKEAVETAGRERRKRVIRLLAMASEEARHEG